METNMTTWEFPSTTTSEIHTVTLVDPRTRFLTCTCTGFKYRRDCWHTKAVAEKISPAVAPADNKFLRAALDYHKMGYHVIPVEPNGKRPLVQWKDFMTVKPTLGQIKTWWMRTPNANVAIVLGQNRFAVDLDGGAEAEKLLADAGIELPADAPRSKTGGGNHVFLSAPTPQPDRIGLLKAAEPLAGALPTPKGKLRHAQIDIRGLGIIIAAPSVHPSGAVYTWLTPLTATPPMASDALLELIAYVPPPPPKKPRAPRKAKVVANEPVA